MAAPERFRPTAGRITGWLGVGLGIIVAVVAVADTSYDKSWVVFFAALLFVAVTWAAALRPALWVDEDALTMRNMLTTTVVPLAAIRELAIRQFLAIRAGDRRYVSPVIGRSLRKTLKADLRVLPGDAALPATPGSKLAVRETVASYPDFVEERIRHLAEAARSRAEVRMGSQDQEALAEGVRRQVAWPVIGLIAALAVAVVISALLS